MTFAGFPSRPQSTAIPNVFFTDVLPLLSDDAAAIGVALYAFKALQSKRGSPRFVTEDELASDGALAAFIGAAGGDPGEGLRRGLGRAVDVGVLLGLTVEDAARRRELYFLNTPADRRGMESVRTGVVDLGCVVAPAPAASTPPTIFALYEALIGTLGPGIAEELADAERLYPADWLEAAFREAAAQNVRSWRYVTRILERWASEGRDHAKTERDSAGVERYFSGKYGRILKQRLGD